MDKKVKICFLADKHSLYDERIYWKMAVPLFGIGYDVYYLLIGEENRKGVTKEGINFEIFKLKTFSKNRYLNFLIKRINPNNNYKLLLRESAQIEADIYHFHDLWINRIGRKLKNLEHKPVVFYDAREPYAEDYKSLINSNGIFKTVHNLFSIYVDRWEKFNAKYYDLVITNENTVRDNFRNKIGEKKAETIFNFSDIYIKYRKFAIEDKEYDFIYCGGINEYRGVMKILEATKIAIKTIPTIKVVFVGKYTPSTLKIKLQEYIDNNNLNNNVKLCSFVQYSEVSTFYNKSKIGLITWLPLDALTIKMPIKIFEYMAFGLPIIGSNFGHINSYIKKENCGLVVNPLDPKDISRAMINLLTDKNKYALYSENGRDATLRKYKWEFEFERLVEFYNTALKNREN